MDDIGRVQLQPPEFTRLLSNPGPPGVGSPDKDGFDFANSVVLRSVDSSNWIPVTNTSKSVPKDPRLRNKKPPEDDIPKQFENPRTSRSPDRSKKQLADKKSQRSMEKERDRSPKRGRERYRENRFERDDRYERRGRGRRTPSPPLTPTEIHQAPGGNFRTELFHAPPQPTPYMPQQPPPPMYSDGGYQTYPASYGPPPVQQPPPPQTFGYQPMENYGGQATGPPQYVQNFQPTPMNVVSQQGPSTGPGKGAGMWMAPNLSPQQTALPPVDDQVKREAAIASEVRQQKATLVKQREEYLRKASLLKREIQSLKEARVELKSSSRNPPSPDSQRFLKENAKLQLEIGNKLKTINNVIEMLTGIIGEKKKSPSVERPRSKPRTPDSSPERTSRQTMDNSRDSFPGKGDHRQGSVDDRSSGSKQVYNYIHYDPEMHWCQICNVFPKTAKEYLNHLHSQMHTEQIEKKQIQEAPWHCDNSDDELPTYAGAPTKRLPIRGLQHFTPATAWFCKLCNKWMGDLHCASQHLKSRSHAETYSHFVDQNPHWETDWMADRQKSYERKAKPDAKEIIYPTKTLEPVDESHLAGVEEKTKKKRSKKEKKAKKKSKKRRKSSSSDTSSSNSSESDESETLNDKALSIRVAMRNKLKAQAAAALLMKETVANAGKWLDATKMDKKPEEPKLHKTPKPPPPPPPAPPAPKAPPPPPVVELKRNERDEKMLAQWMVHKGVSETDKKMFDALRDRLKQRQDAVVENKNQNDAQKDEKKEEEVQKEVKKDFPKDIHKIEKRGDSNEENSRKETRDSYDSRASKRSYDYNRSRDREDRGYGSYYRGGGYRGRDNYRDRRGHSDRYERSYSDRERKRYHNSRSRSRSRSRSPDRKSRVEIGVITNPPPPPKLAKFEKRSDNPDRPSEPKIKTIKPMIGNKKLPFIGRMPVFKSKPKDDKEEKDKETAPDGNVSIETAKQRRDEINAQIQVALEKAGLNVPPPPPPIINNMPPVPNTLPLFELVAPPPPKLEANPVVWDKVGMVDITVPTFSVMNCPPASAETKPMTENDKKALPKDFEDALDIIFPDEKKPEPPPPVELNMMPPTMVPHMPPPMMPYPMEQMVYPPMYPMEQTTFNTDYRNQVEKTVMEDSTHERAMMIEMDDMAMLGIDQGDITAQHF